MAVDDFAVQKAFDDKLETLNMRGQWIANQQFLTVLDGPTPLGLPYVWKWDQVHALLLEALAEIPQATRSRRNISFINPVLDRGTTHTMIMGIQYLSPGERAWAHRHPMAAIRFVSQGHADAFSVVDGVKCPMEDFDLILTPPYAWHDHGNESQTPVTWVDIVDSPLFQRMNAMFYEKFDGTSQPIRNVDPDPRPGTLRPVWDAAEPETVPGGQPLRYAWRSVAPQLYRLADGRGDPCDGIALEYTNPLTGGPVLPTMSCWVQMLRPGEATRAHRHTTSAVYFVVKGSGRTEVGDETLEWNLRDSFAVPNWAWHRHVNDSKTEEAILFSVNDRPAMAPLGMYREEMAE